MDVCGSGGNGWKGREMRGQARMKKDVGTLLPTVQRIFIPQAGRQSLRAPKGGRTPKLPPHRAL